MSSRPTIAYQPALDGVRAVAVTTVVLFHASVPGFDGGYLGVSVFFTLSGYLITCLLVREFDTTGRIDLPAFYGRRLRRLMPASLLVVSGVVLLAAVSDLFDGVADLRAQVLGSLFQISNWVLLAGDGSYQDLLARATGSSSPLEHFWSLAIEEQFYWFWPPLFAAIVLRAPHQRGRTVAVGAITALAAVAAPVIAAVWGPDAAYWATPARLSEILLGALLAVVLAGREVSERFAGAAYASLVLILVCVVTFPSSGGPAYAGALPLFALLSVALIVGLQVPSPLRSMLSVGPVVLVGKVSYGLYLFHWPVFVVVHPDRFDWSEPALFCVRMLVTVAITAASYTLLEQPIRSWRGTSPRATFVAAGSATAVAAAAVVALPLGGVGEYWQPDAEVAEASAIDLDGDVSQPLTIGAPVGPTPTTSVTASPSVPPNPVSTAPPAATASPTTQAPTTVADAEPPLPELARPARILVVGDSTANAFGTGLQTWAANNPDLAQVEVIAAPGCGFLEGGDRRIGDTVGPDGCEGWVDSQVLPEVGRLQPDVVAAMVTSWDLIDRRWGDGELIGPLDPAFAARLDADYEALLDDLAAAGAPHVAFIRHPNIDPFWLDRVDAQEDPNRHAVIYGLYERLASDSANVSVVPLDRWMNMQGLTDDREVRPDGIHPTPEAATDIGEFFLGEQLVRVALGIA